MADEGTDGGQHPRDAPFDFRARTAADLDKNRLLKEITPDDPRAHCGKIVDRGAPATAIHVRDILKQIYGFAILHGERIANPADDVGPASIATFVPKDRSLSPTEIRIMLKQLEHVATLPTIRLGMRLFLLNLPRQSGEFS